MMADADPHARIVVHLSDLHFGHEDPQLVDALRAAVLALAPTVVAISGDLTQRARRAQFRDARTFLESLPFPQIVVPGNHDIPLYNLLARAFDPLGGYTRFITSTRLPTYTDGLLWLAGVDTTRASRWKSGHIPAATLHRVTDALALAPPEAVRVLVAHHPFDQPDAAGVPPAALSALTSAGIDVFLTGHLHASYAGPSAHRYKLRGRAAVVVEAGTATSTRRRGEPNAFNVLRVTASRIEVETWSWDGRGFGSVREQQFARSGDGWAEI